MTRLTPAQAKTLRNIHEAGGKANRYAGQRGLNVRSMDALARQGLLRELPSCDACRSFFNAVLDGKNTKDAAPCERNIGGARCCRPVEITDAGREALNTQPASR